WRHKTSLSKGTTRRCRAAWSRILWRRAPRACARRSARSAASRDPRPCRRICTVSGRDILRSCGLPPQCGCLSAWLKPRGTTPRHAKALGVRFPFLSSVSSAFSVSPVDRSHDPKTGDEFHELHEKQARGMICLEKLFPVQPLWHQAGIDSERKNSGLMPKRLYG